MRTASKSFSCAPRRHEAKDDELLAWARRVATTPSPLVTDREREIIAALVLQAEAGR